MAAIAGVISTTDTLPTPCIVGSSAIAQFSSAEEKRGAHARWPQKERRDLFPSVVSSNLQAALMADQKTAGRGLTPQASKLDVLSSEK